MEVESRPLSVRFRIRGHRPSCKRRDAERNSRSSESARTYSSRLLPLIEWRATEEGEVEVLNETGAWYRYFDATAHADYIYRCVRKTIDVDLRAEVDDLRAFEWLRDRVSAMADRPRKTLDLLHGYCAEWRHVVGAGTE